MEFILENYTELIQSQDWMNFLNLKSFVQITVCKCVVCV